MKYHKTVSKIIELLKNNGYWFETFEHEPVRTSEEASKIRPGYSLRQGAKAMIIRVKVSGSEKRFVMLVLPGDLRFDNNKVRSLFGVREVRFATEEEVIQITGGILPGGIPPFGNLFNLEVIADPKLFENEKIVFSAGDRRFSIAMQSKDYKALVNPRIVPIALR